DKINKWFGDKNGQPPQKKIIMEDHGFLDASVIAQLKKMGGENDPSFLKDVIELFVNLTPGVIQEMDDSCRAKDFKKMGLAAHKLKGSALNIGAAKLAEVCKELEIKGGNGDGTDCEKMISEVKEI